MPCPVCAQPLGADHRLCVFKLLEENKIQTVDEWERLTTKPVTIVKGRVRITVKKDDV
jgi:hypothetical protein